MPVYLRAKPLSNIAPVAAIATTLRGVMRSNTNALPLHLKSYYHFKTQMRSHVKDDVKAAGIIQAGNLDNEKKTTIRDKLANLAFLGQPNRNIAIKEMKPPKLRTLFLPYLALSPTLPHNLVCHHKHVFEKVHKVAKRLDLPLLAQFLQPRVPVVSTRTSSTKSTKSPERLNLPLLAEGDHPLRGAAGEEGHNQAQADAREALLAREAKKGKKLLI
ncbi:hypothetical protein PRZ48_012212 [Zasmidium cellare]|uniref:Uncharacterized protein n=1 Tax=Zasmidium cellare TaxID=395010 RepID=A0ABR0E475_ZASCE|nr:hypothetical protein PRZ48_012212 [Zasmidium cellare]